MSVSLLWLNLQFLFSVQSICHVHSDISCVIIIPGEEIDSAHTLLTQTTRVDYEQLCHLDVMGLADTPEDDQVKCTNREQLTCCEASVKRVGMKQYKLDQGG